MLLGDQARAPAFGLECRRDTLPSQLLSIPHLVAASVVSPNMAQL